MWAVDHFATVLSCECIQKLHHFLQAVVRPACTTCSFLLCKFLPYYYILLLCICSATLSALVFKTRAVSIV